jgi:hypothetical protein
MIRQRPLGGPTHIWENNIKMDFKETGCDYADWIHLTHNTVQ